jgi:hypothetical protein
LAKQVVTESLPSAMSEPFLKTIGRNWDHLKSQRSRGTKADDATSVSKFSTSNELISEHLTLSAEPPLLLR